jgi:hypothetical protein
VFSVGKSGLLVLVDFQTRFGLSTGSAWKKNLLLRPADLFAGVRGKLAPQLARLLVDVGLGQADPQPFEARIAL